MKSLLLGLLLFCSTVHAQVTTPAKAGAKNFKTSVANPASLPLTGNTAGDSRVSLSNASLYIWDGASWQGIVGGGASLWGAITGTLSNQTDLNTALNGKEPTITAATAAEYFRGDKTFQTLNTTAVPEGTNLYFTNGRFDTRFGLKTTTDLAEGTNLYYTDGRFDTRLGTKSTTDLAEGTNLYYTQGRFDTAFTAKDTDDLSEGATNLYFTNGRAQSAVVTQAITDGVLTTSPSENEIFDALALKQSTSEKDQNNGYAGLDAGGKIAISALPNTVMTFEGQWNATTNTPALADGTGNAGDVYRANVAGTTNFGSGPIAFNLGDWAVYNGTVWEYAANSNLVMSVNGQQGVVVLDTDDIAEGTNLYFTDARARAAVIASSISDGDTTHSPDGNSVFDALALKEPNITATTSADYYRGDKTFQTLNNVAVGLGNVGNVKLSDAGTDNLAIGPFSANSLTTGTGNLMVGEGAGFSHNGKDSVFAGTYAGYYQTGSVAPLGTALNVFMGYQAGSGSGPSASTSYHTTAIGAYSGYGLTTGYDNTFLGMYSGLNNSTGRENTYIGRSSGHGPTTGIRNSCLGSYSCLGNGNNNSGLGHRAMQFVTGNSNIGLGSFAGNNQTASNRLFIGSTAAGYQINTIQVDSSNANGAVWLNNLDFTGSGGTLFVDTQAANDNSTKAASTGYVDAAVALGGIVSSVFGRTGAVVSATSDYDAIQVDNTPAGNIVATNAQAAIDELDTEKLAIASFTDTAVTGKLITGFVSGAGTVAATDTILQAINKLDGNVTAASATPASSNITGNTTLASPTRIYFCDTTGGAFTVTLPAAASNDGVSFTVKHTTFGGANDVTVATGETIDGEAGDTLTAGEGKTYISNGTSWFTSL